MCRVPHPAASGNDSSLFLIIPNASAKVKTYESFRADHFGYGPNGVFFIEIFPRLVYNEAGRSGLRMPPTKNNGRKKGDTGHESF